MILLPMLAGPDADRASRDPDIGWLITPRRTGSASNGRLDRFAVDNDCFSAGADYDFDAYLRLLWRVRDYPGRCLWASCPDVVGNAEGTARRWQEYAPAMRETGLPLAYVLQDGQDRLPWGEYQAVFVGGSTAYKMASAPLIRQAKQAGLLVHVGRVNSAVRMRWAWHAGADSIDGTCWAINPGRHLRWALRELAWQRQQLRLLA